MKKVNLALAGISSLAVILLIYLWLNNKKLEEQKAKIEELEKDKLLLLKEHLNNSENSLSAELKTQIEKLIEEYQGVSDDIVSELASVLQLININEETKAIKSLAKIIENILKERFEDDTEFKEKKKRCSLANLLSYAKEINIITKHEFSFGWLLKDIRNEESHELNVNSKKPANWKTIAFFAGIEIIFKLKGVRR